MAQLELAGAPLAWLWLFIITSTIALPPLVMGLIRRGTGIRGDASFLIQRAPQLAVALVFSLVAVSFEVIEFALGTGEPSFGKDLFEGHIALLPIASVALVLPATWAVAVSWIGVAWTLVGCVLFITGLYTGVGRWPERQIRRVCHWCRRAGNLSRAKSPAASQGFGLAPA